MHLDKFQAYGKPPPGIWKKCLCEGVLWFTQIMKSSRDEYQSEVFHINIGSVDPQAGIAGPE